MNTSFGRRGRDAQSSTVRGEVMGRSGIGVGVTTASSFLTLIADHVGGCTISLHCLAASSRREAYDITSTQCLSQLPKSKFQCVYVYSGNSTMPSGGLTVGRGEWRRTDPFFFLPSDYATCKLTSHSSHHDDNALSPGESRPHHFSRPTGPHNGHQPTYHSS